METGALSDWRVAGHFLVHSGELHMEAAAL